VPAKMPVGAGLLRTVHGLVKWTVVGDDVEESPLAEAVPENAILSALATSLNNAQLSAVVTSNAKIVFFMFIFLFLGLFVGIEALI